MLKCGVTSHLKLTTMDVDVRVLNLQLSRNDFKTNGESSKYDWRELRQRKIHSISQLAYEWIRLATFDCWTTKFVDKGKLARSGFFCMKANDLVQCFFCKGVVGFWENDDDPSEEHRRHFPNCPFVQGQDTSNVSLVQEGNELHTFLNSYIQYSLEHQKPFIPKMKYQTDAILVNPSNISYKSYSSYESRLQSLRNWPQNIYLPNAENLAKAGFFYTGISDIVKCFSCGGGLFNWNVTDDPMKNHLLYYEFCSFIRMEMKPLNSIANISCQSVVADESTVVPFRSKKLSSNEEDLLLQYSFSKRLLSMGLNAHSIKKALSEYIQNYSHLPGSLMNCIEVIIEWEDEKEKKNLDEENAKSIQDKPPEGLTISKSLTFDADHLAILVEEGTHYV